MNIFAPVPAFRLPTFNSVYRLIFTVNKDFIVILQKLENMELCGNLLDTQK